MYVPILIAGPCSVESEEQALQTASEIQHYMQESPNFQFLYYRAGIWKPRSDPDSFEGLGEKAIPILQKIKTQFDMDSCVEVAQPEHIEICLKAGIKVFWIGARTTVNPFQVERLAKTCAGEKGLTVLIKNPVNPDLKLWIGAIERFEKQGISNIYAVHRGFNIAEHPKYRNIPYWHIPIEFCMARPNIPLLCDPSHICGNKLWIREIAQKALDLAYAGLMIETHATPKYALSDANQQITPYELSQILKSLHLKTFEDKGKEELTQLRNRIEDIDEQLIFLLKMRLNTVEKIAKIKHQYNLPLLQPQQWKKVESRYLEFARQENIDKEVIQEFLNMLHVSSIQRQQGKD